MKTLSGILALLCFLPFRAAAGEPAPDQSLRDLITAAEKEFYRVDQPDRFVREAAILDLIEKLYPKDPYPYWARARLVFFEKENYYVTRDGDKPEDLERKKLALADTCQTNANQCIKLAPRNPECRLLKGSCYAMQASTWGVTYRSLRVCKPMDDEWARAMELPSDFVHPDNVTTRQLAQILRAILARVMPDSFWFRLLAGVRGNKERSYNWMTEAATGSLSVEPMIVLEQASSTLCYAQQKKKPEVTAEALELLRKGLLLPTRYAMDEFDKKNIQYVLDNPDQACNYRRERFEDLSEGHVKIRVK